VHHAWDSAKLITNVELRPHSFGLRLDDPDPQDLGEEALRGLLQTGYEVR
jgi:hypothetical protein